MHHVVVTGREELGSAEGGTHYVGGARAVSVGGRVGVAAATALSVSGALARPRAVPLVDHQVDGHLALQTADVSVAEVVAELVHLRIHGHVSVCHVHAAGDRDSPSRAVFTRRLYAYRRAGRNA